MSMVIVEYDDRTIGDVIKDRRLERQMSRTDLARKANVSRCAIENYENGYTTPSILLLRKLLHALGVDEVRIRT